MGLPVRPVEVEGVRQAERCRRRRAVEWVSEGGPRDLDAEWDGLERSLVACTEGMRRGLGVGRLGERVTPRVVVRVERLGVVRWPGGCVGVWRGRCGADLVRACACR